jgi:hypothetical protein
MLMLRRLRRHLSGVATLAVVGIASLGAFTILRVSEPEMTGEVTLAFALLYGFLAGLTLQVVRKTMPHGAQRRHWELYAVVGGFLTVFVGGSVVALVSTLCGR